MNEKGSVALIEEKPLRKEWLFSSASVWHKNYFFFFPF
jgi:hypothetical protein